MTGARIRMLVALLVLAAGCDEVVKGGETVVADNGGSIWAFNTPNAVQVQPGGTLVVANASLFGLGKRIDTLPTGQFPAPGTAIASNGGTVVIQKGRIAGGNILLQIDPSTVPPLPRANLSPLASALQAFDSVVEIDGGTLISSGVIGQPNQYVAVGPTVDVFRGQLRIRGGELLLGAMSPAPDQIPGESLSASTSLVEISGGDFEGVVNFFESRATITGGRFAGGIVMPTVSERDITPPTLTTPCYEIRGGTIPSILASIDPIFIFGSGFNLPLGRVPIPGPKEAFFAPPLLLTGVLADGSPLRLVLTAPRNAPVILVAPGGAGCGPVIRASEQ